MLCILAALVGSAIAPVVGLFPGIALHPKQRSPSWLSRS